MKRTQTITLDEVKEYSDAGIQAEAPTHSFCTQTDPEPRVVTSSFSTQTDEPRVSASACQTDPEPQPSKPVMASMSIQTDDLEDEDLASSSATLRPPTPTPKHPDLPPSYTQVQSETKEELTIRVRNETLMETHSGLKIPTEGLPQDGSPLAAEALTLAEGAAGMQCSVLRQVIQAAVARNKAEASSDSVSRNRELLRLLTLGLLPAKSTSTTYNTYILNDARLLSNLILCVGASAAVAFLVGSSMASSATYAIPGGPTYYDRAAWTSFNSIQAVGEGFPGDGSSRVFWSFLGRLGGGAARSLRGWPT